MDTKMNAVESRLGMTVGCKEDANVEEEYSYILVEINQALQ